MRDPEGEGAFAGSYAKRGQLMDAMERWNDEVKSTVPAERLLVFLDVDVPVEPVPKVNDTEAFKQGIIGGAVQSVQQWWDREQATAA